MKYYTKEWYGLMQCQHYTDGLTAIPDKIYSDAEIQAFFDYDLQAEIERDRRIYNTPPSSEWAGNFEEQTRRFNNRPPFDPTETIECFKECYRIMVRHSRKSYPAWVSQSVDARLLALHRIPESAYRQLREEERANKRAFDKIEADAAPVLKAQDIPDKIRSIFSFHDANLLALKKVRSDLELYLRDGGYIGGTTPYSKVIFKNIRRTDREKGFVIRPRLDQNREYSSGCYYLYDELYRDENGYEVHILLWTRKSLRYLTVACEDIEFEDSIRGFESNAL